MDKGARRLIVECRWMTNVGREVSVRVGVMPACSSGEQGERYPSAWLGSHGISEEKKLSIESGCRGRWYLQKPAMLEERKYFLLEEAEDIHLLLAD